jgi:CRISPR-associated endoribonuclease Cas6
MNLVNKSQRLVSAVFVLRHDTPFRSTEPHLGRAAHAIALNFIRYIAPQLSQELHNYNGILPYTVSNLFQSDSEHHWLRVTGLRNDVVEVLETLADMDEPCVDNWTIVMGLTRMHDWSGHSTVEALLAESWQDGSRLELEFETPTAVKSKGLYRSLPEPVLIFKSLYARWQDLIETDPPYAPEPAVLDDFLTYAVSVDFYRLRSRTLEMKHTVIPTFSGEVRYRVLPPTRKLRRQAKKSETAAQALAYYDDLTRLLNLLVAFSFYSGVGIKTAQGMGMTRPKR